MYRYACKLEQKKVTLCRFSLTIQVVCRVQKSETRNKHRVQKKVCNNLTSKQQGKYTVG